MGPRNRGAGVPPAVEKRERNAANYCGGAALSISRYTPGGKAVRSSQTTGRQKTHATACSAAASLRACTIAIGWPDFSGWPNSARPVRPTAWSMPSSARWRPPPDQPPSSPDHGNRRNRDSRWPVPRRRPPPHAGQVTVRGFQQIGRAAQAGDHSRKRSAA